MNRNDLITKVAEKAELSKKDTDKMLSAFMDTVKETLTAGETIQIIGFGTFEVSERSAREGRNPKTGEPVHIDACKTPKFKASKALKDAVNV